MKKIALPACITALCILLVACGNPNQRLDEYLFYDGPQFRLKVVRYFRNIPFNQLGEHAVVMCQSENTTEFPVHERQDAGWRTLGSADAPGSKDAREAALQLKDDYIVLDDHTLVGKTNVFNISFDACGHFINWDPSRLPQAMIDPVKKPDSCAPNGPVDCRYLDFEGERAPRYEQIHVAGTGQVSFAVSSASFKGVKLLRVDTRNNGEVWHVQSVGPDTGRQRLETDAIQSLPMSLLENGMDDASLMDWLESALPSRSMVIWPDTPGPCINQDQADKQSTAPRCAAIRFNDIQGNSGTLYISINTGPENGPGEMSFHSGVYSSGGSHRRFESLAGLHQILTADTE